MHDDNDRYVEDRAERRPVRALVRIGAAGADETERLTHDIVAALKTVFDPEIPADIYELGLIYKVDISDDRSVAVEMTLTTPNCPAAGELPSMVENAVASVPGVGAEINLVWEPAWTPDGCRTRPASFEYVVRLRIGAQSGSMQV